MHSPHYQASCHYDSVGNLIEYSYTDPLGSENNTYKYDDLNQLTSENEHDYQYDSLFNRTGKDNNPYSLNPLCQIIYDGQKEYAYDKNGNLISDGESTYEYDLLDRLIAVTKEKTRTTYAYDAFNRRISKNDELYMWDDKNEMGMSHGGRVRELRILGEGLGAEIGSSVIIEIDGHTYFPIHDIQGSLATMIDTNRKSNGTYRFTAFGEQLTKDNDSPWRFASKRYDEETDFVYFGRRYYSPNLGRWITADPQGFNDGPNLYAYLQNSPLTDFDLYGLWSMREAWSNAQHFIWGILEGSGYHFYNMASSFGMRDFSSTNTWQPRSLLSNQDHDISTRGMDWVERSVLPFTYEARLLGSDVSQQVTMRARGRAFGEQAITLGGIFSVWNVGKNFLNIGPRFQNTTRMPVLQELSREYFFSGKVKTPQNANSGRSKNWLQPNMEAEGAHSVLRRDPITGQVNHYVTYRPQTNPYDPKRWELVKRYDGPWGLDGRHYNKFLKSYINNPHIHDPYTPGGVRLPEPWEIPK